MSETSLVTMLAKAQADMENATLNKINPHFKSKYADLASIRDAVVPALSKVGIAVVQAIETREYGPVVVTKLMKGKEEIASECPVIVGDKVTSQQFGSALTYARRYSLASICSISANEDDDANAATETGTADKPKKAEPRQSGSVTASDDPMRDEYTRVKRAINECADAGSLNTFWENEKTALEAMKKHSLAGYEGLHDAYNTKLDSFNIMEAAE